MPDSHDADLMERQRIREVVQNWALWRDAGDWDRFRTVWHPEARMMATWFQGPAEKFIEVSREGWNKGVSILHFLGGSAIDLAGERAIAQTKMTISQRAAVDGREDEWRIVLRQPIYEKDRLDPVDPAAVLKLDASLLARFPEGYRHLAYLQTRIGYAVKRDMPGLTGAEVERLYAAGARWLAGKHLDW